MLQVWLYTIISLVIVSLISLIGVLTLSVRREWLQKILLYLVSFAVGGLFGDALIHLLPEAFDQIENSLGVSLCVVAGLLIFFVLEKFLRWQHCHIPTSKDHTHPVVTLNLVGDAVHNFIDGMIIGTSFLASIPIGITTAIAVVLHEIPQEIGDFGILVHGGLPVRKALFYNFLSALVAVLGGVVALLLGPYLQEYIMYLLPVTAGGFLYIAGSDLIPELHHHGPDDKPSSALFQFLMIVLGVGLMVVLRLLD